MEGSDGEWRPREHAPEELEEHQAAIEQLEKAITDWKRSLDPAPVTGSRPPQQSSQVHFLVNNSLPVWVVAPR